MQNKVSYLFPTPAGYTTVTRRIGKRRTRLSNTVKARVASFSLILISINILGIAEFTRKIGTQLSLPTTPIVQASSEGASEELSSTPTPSTGSAISNAPSTSTDWEEFVTAVEKIAPIYNYPKNVVLAQGALESARGTSTFARERNNYLGIGAYDSNPDQAFRFENAEQGVIYYMEMIKRNFPEAWSNRDNPEALLQALKVNKSGRMYATDPNYESKVKSMVEWKKGN